MPNKELLNTIAMLQSIRDTVGLNKQQSRLLCISTLRLRYGWVAQAALHLAFAVTALLFYSHLSHLYKVQAICSAADAVSMATTKTESSQRGYVLTGKESYLKDYQYYSQLVHMRVAYLCSIIPASKENNELCQNLAHDMGMKLSEMESTVIDIQDGHVDKAMRTIQTDQGLGLMRSVEYSLGHIRFAATTPGKKQGSCLTTAK